LHERKGFDVLAWESGMWECRDVNRAMTTSMPTALAASVGVFRIWTRSAEVQPVLDYVRSTRESRKPIETAGFDCQVSSQNMPRHFFDSLSQSFAKAGVAVPSQGVLSPEDVPTLSDIVRSPKRMAPIVAATRAMAEAIETNRAKFDAAHGTREVDFQLRALRNWDFFYRSMIEARAGNQVVSSTIRDTAMADNLAYLANDHYKGRKVIVWAANYHTSRALNQIQMPGERSQATTMGQRLAEIIPRGTYSIAFTSHEGRSGAYFEKPRRLLPARHANSFEEIAASVGSPYLFVDLRGGPAWLQRPFASRALGATTIMGRWDRNFDALFFIREMEPSTRHRPPKP
jgi:erythromycin esterase